MPPDRDPWSEARALLRNAPPKVRRVVRINIVAATAGIALAVIDVMTGTNEFEVYRLLGIVMAMIGMVLMTEVYVLHHLSQHEGTAGAQVKMSLFRLHSTRLHAALRIAALLGIVSALVFAVAIGLLVPSVVHAPMTVAALAVLLFYLGVTLRTVRHLTDFMYRQAREQAEAATDARLRTLQAQMQPHFLFNALNTIAALVRSDPPQAERTVENLAQVLRRGLDRSRRGMGTVREEVEFIRAWLAVEQQRWGERLSVDWRVDDDVLDLALPPMTLQPLVENALKHGLAGRIAGGHITVGARRVDGRLHLTVTDDGAGVAPDARDGTGLGNLKARLRARFGDAARVAMTSGPHGTVVDMVLPVRAEEND